MTVDTTMLPVVTVIVKLMAEAQTLPSAEGSATTGFPVNLHLPAVNLR